ncbi:hypothetical protein CCC_00783 [Paramagnetospirillum magnetotacticum MS-1]|uniref:Sporadic carbohydrate cluster 2OG-Fe(II) oxygenase n=1 Tax=Paramagnetospirillum magnetotacticum MS-1 TaxID=272627 RepID=A0A0C2U898_PARME|nr:sporadic carbohydrate cluster 2OG-Fe(II) oxygenase [Paramagnetospirillum magnetotacticum]KIL97722.1 hypothetical protein CCC_00783 [Paramagnetospirillum magnetotacticum MS-1]
MSSDFLTAEEHDLAQHFLVQGRVVLPVEDREGLDRLRSHIALAAAAHLGLPAPSEAGVFLDSVHNHVDPARLNDLRLAAIDAVNAAPWSRPLYFRLARSALYALVGSELAMQRRLNLSIQLPGDASSLLPLHSDVWSGDSPYEVVVWLPLVDCRATKSMFIASPEANIRWAPRLAEFRSTEELFQAARTDLSFLDISYGQVLVFNQTLMHGNRVNAEAETRWSMNCRFKGVFTPYADKRIGEFFEPITLRPASRVGLEYRLPGGNPP